MNHAYACRKDAAGEPTCKQWCGRQDLCLSTLTYPEDYMQSAYEHGLRDGLERATKTDGADRRVLEARLAECLSEREARQKLGWGYGQSVSDKWLERDIAALQRMLADGVQEAHERQCECMDCAVARGVAPSPAYRLLAQGEQIKAGDEVLSDDTLSWLPLVGWETRITWDGAALMPIRRCTRGVGVVDGETQSVRPSEPPLRGFLRDVTIGCGMDES